MKTEVSNEKADTGEVSKKETALLAWLFFLLLGGGLLALYYARIGYLPDIEWHLTLVYLAVVSFIGGALGILQSLAIFLPGYIWSESLIHDSQITKAFCHGGEDEGTPSVYWIFLHLGIPFLICLIASHLALLGGIYLYILVAVLSIVGVSVYVWWWFPRLVTTGGVADAPRKCKYAFWFGLSVLLNQIAVLLVYYLSGQPEGESLFNISCVCIFIVLVTNHVVSVLYRINARHAKVASLAASLLLLVAADQFTHLPEQIMALYGFGGGHKVNILVNDDGASLIERLGLPNTACGQTARNNVCGAEILSGVGSEYLIKLGDTKFTLPKSMVISRSAKDIR